MRDWRIAKSQPFHVVHAVLNHRSFAGPVHCVACSTRPGFFVSKKLQNSSWYIDVFSSLLMHVCTQIKPEKKLQLASTANLSWTGISYGIVIIGYREHFRQVHTKTIFQIKNHTCAGFLFEIRDGLSFLVAVRVSRFSRTNRLSKPTESAWFCRTRCFPPRPVEWMKLGNIGAWTISDKPCKPFIKERMRE